MNRFVGIQKDFLAKGTSNDDNPGRKEQRDVSSLWFDSDLLGTGFEEDTYPKCQPAQ